MATLVNPDNPFIRGLSIRGAWMAQPETVEADDGKDATTASDLDVFGIDWTGRPGVEGAQITHAEIFESIDATNPILESVEAEVIFNEEELDDGSAIAEADAKKPYGDVTYADNGYQKDGKKRYPIDTAAHVKAAWAYINVTKNASAYSSGQVARIKTKIKTAAKKFNINVTEDFDALADDIKDLLEAYASMSIDNGGGSISASGYTDDAGKLAPMARRIATAAIIGLNALDPDADGDIDLTMPDGSTDSSSSQEAVVVDDNNMESATCSECGVDMPQGALFCPTCGQAVPNAESETPAVPETKEALVATETDTPVAEATPVEATPVVTAPVAEATPAPAVAAAPAQIVLTQEQFDALLARSAPVAEAAPVAAPVAEAAPVVEDAPATFTQADIDKIKEDAKVEADLAALEAARAAGIIPRTGLVAGQTAGQFNQPVAELSEAKTAKELSEMDDDELKAYSTETFMAAPGWGRLFRRADEHVSQF
jgi:uncharacterized Zn finger protein (UPF0148 family)